MTNLTNPISSVSGLSSGTNIPSKSTSSTSEIISSFKEIMSVMTAMNGLSSINAAMPYQSPGMGMNMGMGTGMGMNMSDLMAPLMMLMLERLIEQTLESDEEAGHAHNDVSGLNSTGAVYGSKPVPSGRPVDSGRVTQNPRAGHMAFDIGIPVGTPIKTTMDGKVIHAGWNDQGYGNLVIVENGDYRTYYAHLSSIPVEMGELVAAGSVIGLSGNTGNSTGPHLHYEIRKNKVLIDPTTATFGS